MSAVSATRTLARASLRSLSAAQAPKFIANRAAQPAQRSLQHSTARHYNSSSSSSSSKTTSNAFYVGGAAAALVAALAGGYSFVRSDNTIPEVHMKQGSADQSIGLFKPTQEDYQKVYNAIASLLWEKDEYDDGSYGPVVLRLAWHASGTYDAATGTGGSNGATMRFAPESTHGANSGLHNAREFLEPIKKQFPWISYSDLWTLGGVCAVQEMQGPVVPWRPGRKDRDETYCTPDGRLPDGAKGHDHIRAIFGRMGFNDQEMVALFGAHALGRCHVDRSGFDGPWTFSPTVLTNDFYRLLVEEKWNWRDWNGNKQYQDSTSKSLMMLPADMALVQDESFKQYIIKYAQDEQTFFTDFSNVICKLFELGVPFKEGAERLSFMTLGQQEEREEE